MHTKSAATAATVAMAAFALAAQTAPHAVATDYQYVRTASGLVRCVVGQAEVACERGSADGFPQAPASADGGRWNLAITNAGGSFKWNEGNIGGADIDQDVVLAYGKTYRFNGWTIMPSSDGTRFTNDGTGHGMFVSVENVSSF
jgi:hypothetical protein